MIRHTASRGAHRAITIAAAIAATALVVTGCSTTPPADEKAELTFWTWANDPQPTIDLFEAAHPNITVTVENVGVGDDQYTKIQNAVDAGTGGPDLAQMDYSAIPNFVLTGALADISQYGATGMEDTFLPGVLSLVKSGDGIYGVPQDFGPAVMFYRTDVFEAAGVAVPTTWDEYAAAAVALKAANPETYITYLEPGLVDAAYAGLWQLEAQPWQMTSDSEVTLDLTSAKATKWAGYWSDLNQQGLTIESVQGSDEWFKQLGAGQIATWVVGAWGLGALTSVLPENTGLWGVAPQPVWNAGDVGTSQYGGGGTVVLENSEHKEAATEFALWMNGSDEGVQSLKDDQGLLPTTNAAWADPAFTEEKFDYLGGQKAREIFAQSAQDSVVGWNWLPFQPYISSVYADTVGQAISGKTDIATAMGAWQDRIAEYAEEQGFTVTVE